MNRKRNYNPSPELIGHRARAPELVARQRRKRTYEERSRGRRAV